MRYWPLASMTRAPCGTAHSPAAPAQKIRSPRTTVTALATGAPPVPSHRVAPMMAIDGLTGGGATSLVRGAPQATAARPTRPIKAGDAENFMATCSILSGTQDADLRHRNLPEDVQDANGWLVKAVIQKQWRAVMPTTSVQTAQGPCPVPHLSSHPVAAVSVAL